MEAKLSRPGQGATAKRAQDTFVWGLGKPHPQVSCETNRTDPPTHDREQLTNTCKLTYSTDAKFNLYAHGGHGPEAWWECSVGVQRATCGHPMRYTSRL